MDDKAFQLLEKMYSEMTNRFDRVEGEIKGLKKDVLRIEQDHGKKLEALFDGYKQLYEKLEVVEDKVDKHDIKIQVIEGGRKQA